MFSTSDRAFGTEKVSYKYVDMLLKNGHDVMFVHRHDYDLEYVAAEHPKLTLYRLRTRHFSDLLKARGIIRGYKPDIIIVHNHFSRFRILGLGIAPMVGVAHLDKFKPLRSYAGTVVLRPDAVETATANGLKRDTVGLIENTSEFDEPLPQRKSYHTPPVIGAMGRLNVEKNFAVFIAALKILKERSVEFRAVLAGSGPETSELQALATRYGLNSHLTFCGFIKDVGAFFEGIDVFCIPSNFEPFGITLLEAMAFRKPIVASDIASFSLILESGRHGKLFDVSSAPSLATALQELLENPEEGLRLGRSAGNRYSEKFSEAVIYRKLYDFLIRILKHHERSR